MATAPVRQVTRADLELSDLARKLAGNEATRPQFLSMVAKADPNYRLPADVQIKQFEQKQAQKEAEARANWEKHQLAQARANSRKALIDSGRYDEEQVKEIEEKVLKKYWPNGGGDYEAAAKIYAGDFRPANPRQDSQHHRRKAYWEFPVPDKVDAAAFVRDPDKIANDVAYAMIDDFMAARA